MVLRHLFQYLFNNPQMIDKLADSYPIRRAAQLMVYVYHRGKSVGEAGLQDALKTGKERASSFTNNFSAELKKEWEQAKRK